MLPLPKRYQSSPDSNSNSCSFAAHVPGRRAAPGNFVSSNKGLGVILTCTRAARKKTDDAFDFCAIRRDKVEFESVRQCGSVGLNDMPRKPDNAVMYARVAGTQSPGSGTPCLQLGDTGKKSSAFAACTDGSVWLALAAHTEASNPARRTALGSVQTWQ